MPRREHGYCVDDVARGLVVVCREPLPRDELVTLARRYLYFLAKAQAPDGQFRNRLGFDRRWHDMPGTRDCWGRAAVGAWHRRFPGSRRGASGKSRSPASIPARGSAPNGRTPWRSRRSAPPRCSTYRPAIPAALSLLADAVERYRQAARERRVALAGAAAQLRERARSPRRSSWPAGSSAMTPFSAMACTCWNGCWQSRPGAATFRWCPRRRLGSGRAAVLASTSSRSRSPRWPMRARVRRGDRRSWLAGRRRHVRGVVPRRQRRQ